jgi:3-oxoacyl-[acyl-carrier-protein] synthase III
MPTLYDDVFVSGTAFHLPGEPIDNDGMDAYIAPINRISGRIKQRILAENGIRMRHYAIDPDGRTRESNAQMAAAAVRGALADAKLDLSRIDLLACGTSGGDAIMPGFANMVQGELAAPPMHTHTSVGVCAASLGALAFAAAQVQQGDARRALAVGSDLPSRMFKSTRFAPRGYDADFNAHFLRWMLSDGAAALVLEHRTMLDPEAPRLRLKWLHQKSFSGDHPVCMQLGLNLEGTRSYLDYDSSGAAEADGALALRQDIRLLPNLFDVAIHEYAGLVQRGLVDPKRVDRFLCHYSSERFRPVVDELMQKARLAIDPDRWWTNLATRGNTGAASLFVMLSDYLRTNGLREGEQIFCFVPESGRFTVAYALFEVERPGASDPTRGPGLRAQPARVDTATPRGAVGTPSDVPSPDVASSLASVAPPHDVAAATDERQARLLQALAEVWHDYRSAAWRTPLVQAIVHKRFRIDDYRRWMACWIPQVREGSRWMREAVSNMRAPYEAIASIVETHAGEEQFDFQILFDDYRKAGGTVADIDALKRSPGGEALNAFLHAAAAQPSPVGLLGAIYVIEGTGQRIIPALLPLLQSQLPRSREVFRFLTYHGANDENHLARWLRAVALVLEADPTGMVDEAIVNTARRTARLYLMQWEDACARNIPAEGEHAAGTTP